MNPIFEQTILSFFKDLKEEDLEVKTCPECGAEYTGCTCNCQKPGE